MFRPVDLQRLGRAVLPSSRSGLAGERLQETLEERGAVGLLKVLGERWYQLAASTSTQPARGRMTVVFEVAKPGSTVFKGITTAFLHIREKTTPYELHPTREP